MPNASAVPPASIAAAFSRTMSSGSGKPIFAAASGRAPGSRTTSHPDRMKMPPSSARPT
jgi:hypothetical protein